MTPRRWLTGWRTASARQPAADSGFTVVELVVVVVIMGVVMAPLTFGLFQALTYVPRARDVSAASVHRTTLNDRFADDVAQATTIDAPTGTSPATTNLACATSETGAPVTLAQMSWNWAGAGAYRRITYQLQFGATATDGVVPTSVLRLVESVNGGTVTPITTETLLSGYCSPAENAASATWNATGDEGVARQRLLVTLRMRDSYSDERTTPYRMLAVMRKV